MMKIEIFPIKDNIKYLINNYEDIIFINKISNEQNLKKKSLDYEFSEIKF